MNADRLRRLAIDGDPDALLECWRRNARAPRPMSRAACQDPYRDDAWCDWPLRVCPDINPAPRWLQCRTPMRTERPRPCLSHLMVSETAGLPLRPCHLTDYRPETWTECQGIGPVRAPRCVEVEPHTITLELRGFDAKPQRRPGLLDALEYVAVSLRRL